MVRYTTPIFTTPEGARTIGSLDANGKIVAAPRTAFLEFIIQPGDRKALNKTAETGAVTLEDAVTPVPSGWVLDEQFAEDAQAAFRRRHLGRGRRSPPRVQNTVNVVRAVAPAVVKAVKEVAEAIADPKPKEVAEAVVAVTRVVEVAKTVIAAEAVVKAEAATAAPAPQPVEQPKDVVAEPPAAAPPATPAPKAAAADDDNFDSENPAPPSKDETEHAGAKKPKKKHK